MSASTGWEDVYRVQTARIIQLEAEIAALKAGEHLLFSQRLVPKLETENAALREEVVKANGLLDMQMKELAKLREDKERLDWLERKGPWDRWIDPDGPDITLRKPIRDCIDAARKEAQP